MSNSASILDRINKGTSRSLFIAVGLFGVSFMGLGLTIPFALETTVPLGVFSVGSTLIGGGLAIYGGLSLYNARPLPTDPIPPLPALYLQYDDPWKHKTNFRYLEELKDKYFLVESQLQKTYDYSAAARKNVVNAKGYLAYRRWRRNYEMSLAAQETLTREMETLRVRIEHVFDGDVPAEIHQLQESLDKFNREKTESTGDLDRLNSMRDSDNNWGRADIEKQKSAERSYIKKIDMKIIEIESRIKELREFDFQQLYKQLKVSPDAMRMEREFLDVLRQKQEIFQKINPPEKPPPPKVETKAEKKARLEIRLQTLQKEKDAVRANRNLSAEEMTRKINFLDDETNRVQKQLYELL